MAQKRAFFHLPSIDVNRNNHNNTEEFNDFLREWYILEPALVNSNTIQAASIAEVFCPFSYRACELRPEVSQPVEHFVECGGRGRIERALIV
jgi:hypothetical protein